MRPFLQLLALITLVAVPRISCAQEETAASTQSGPEHTKEAPQADVTRAPEQNQTTNPTTPNPNLVNTEEAGESDNIEIPRKMAHWNEYEGPHFTMRAGVGLLYEFAGYSQDKQSKQQFTLDPDFRLRDFRFLLKGSFPSLKRNVTWSTGIMYDAPTKSWLFRETGVMFEVPKLWGYFFIGRTKEGFSLNKVMVGYAGWTIERFTMNDATVPILADGIKWLGYSPKHGFLWNLGCIPMSSPIASRSPRIPTKPSRELLGFRFIRRQRAHCSIWVRTSVTELLKTISFKSGHVPKHFPRRISSIPVNSRRPRRAWRDMKRTTELDHGCLAANTGSNSFRRARQAIPCFEEATSSRL